MTQKKSPIEVILKLVKFCIKRRNSLMHVLLYCELFTLLSEQVFGQTQRPSVPPSLSQTA